MDYCNKYALCKAIKLKALKFSTLVTSDSGHWNIFQQNKTRLLFAPLLQKKFKKNTQDFFLNCIVF